VKAVSVVLAGCGKGPTVAMPGEIAGGEAHPAALGDHAMPRTFGCERERQQRAKAATRWNSARRRRV
jgi:hypothetical protein